CFFKVTSLFAERRHCVIHVNNMPDCLVFSTIIPKICGAKIILDIHDPMPNTFSSKFHKEDGSLFYRILLWQELLSAWYADRVVTVHDLVKDDVLVKHGLAPDSIHVVANFPDLDLFGLREKYDHDGWVKLVY